MKWEEFAFCEGSWFTEDDVDFKVCWRSEKRPHGAASFETNPRNISAVQWGLLLAIDKYQLYC